MSDGGIGTLFANGFHTELEVAGGKARKLVTDDSLDVSQFTVSKTGAVAYVAESSAVLPELFVEGKVVSHFNDGFRGATVQKGEIYTYKSFDGTPIEASLFRGAGSVAGQPQPVMVLIHGGPDRRVARPVRRPHAVASDARLYGDAAEHPGVNWLRAEVQASNRGDWGGGDFKDVMAGVDDMVRRGIADPKRLGIGGWSYGGYMAEWAITQTDRFRFAVSGAGMADLAAEFGTEARSVGDEWYYGTPYENLAGFQKSSPITFIKNAKTPTLILQGEADTTDPFPRARCSTGA